ncbi:hypothetical protein FIBSPDRAFT_953661 [Athelia psychrophila]|uniref:Uncharacterized protein n=1 Tax=Athelia psychrophila TaxID=1759441 RepID=A0A166K0N8_9AGAM|nr:hypothetical protein FIBSPDRAFT_969441 [Fibularhizoctonia sp. CBS 109695]KZP21404.1 hypothetical protein FIBSPDRAFT_953661 [Fibularhizoctonia sp. CBS 109695]
MRSLGQAPRVRSPGHVRQSYVHVRQPQAPCPPAFVHMLANPTRSRARSPTHAPGGQPVAHVRQPHVHVRQPHTPVRQPSRQHLSTHAHVRHPMRTHTHPTRLFTRHHAHAPVDLVP